MPRFQGDNLARNLTVVDGLAEIARRAASTWRPCPWPGCWPRATTSCRWWGRAASDHVADNLAALEVVLSPDDLAAIDEVAPMGAAAGNRYPDSYMPRLGL